jgi:hypothetical protein
MAVHHRQLVAAAAKPHPLRLDKACPDKPYWTGALSMDTHPRSPIPAALPAAPHT